MSSIQQRVISKATILPFSYPTISFVATMSSSKPTDIYLHNMSPDIEELEKDNETCTAKKVRKARRTRLQLRAKMRSLVHMKNNMASASSSPREYLEENHQQQQQQQGLCLSHGSITLCGRRREMEDYVTEATGERYGFFGVYDGHGGSMVAQVCSNRLHMILNEEINGVDVLGLDWERVICDSFAKMDDEINGTVGVGGSDGSGVGVGASGEENEYVKSVGSTAVVAVVENQKLVVANCGDSRAVLCRGGVPVPLSNDHKPDRPDELERVEAAGGRVINWYGYRVLGVLAISRSLGDYYLKPYVISVPEVTVTQRSRTDEFLILASDGLWDVMSNELACRIVRQCLYGSGIPGRLQPHLQETGTGGSVAVEAATVLAELALACGSKDNISVVVVELK